MKKENKTNVKTQHTVAIVFKGGLFGAIALTVGSQGNYLGNYDPRPPRHFYHETHGNPTAAFDAFSLALKTTQERGWQIVYNGQANCG